MDSLLQCPACTEKSAISTSHTHNRWWLLFGLFSVFVLLAGCEDSVDPFKGTELPYTIWGFLNAGTDTQFVRVFPIRDELIPDVNVDLDARVYSTDLTTGERREWIYERVDFDTLIEGHLYWSAFRAEHSHRYRLEVMSPEGEVTSSEITVPSEIEFHVDIRENSTKFPVRIIGDIPNLVGLRVTYNAVNVPPQLAWPVGTPIADAVALPVSIDYRNVVEQTDDGWEMLIDMRRDYTAVREVFRLNCLVTDELGSAPDLWLRGIEFAALAADSSWDPPGGEFDPNLLSVPGTFSNVTNGYGFFGAGQAISQGWTPTVNVSLDAGFNFEAQCQGISPVPIPSCMDPPVPCVGERLPGLWRIWLR